MEKIYTCEEIAARYSVTVYTVREWIKDGKLTGAYKINGKSYRVPESSLREFEQANKTTAR